MNDTTLTPPAPTAAPTAAPTRNPHGNPPYAIYKPNSRGTGGAVRFGLNRAKASIFVEAANQNGDKQFDWEHKIIMKWGLADLGAILAALQARLPQAKLFHQSDKANSACSLAAGDHPDQAPFLLTISRQESEDKQLRKVTIPLTQAEAAVLETALRTAVTRVLGW
jgi:hypothetical protein